MTARRPLPIAVAAVALLLGLLAVVQLRSQGADEALARLSNQDLSVLIGNLTTRNDTLRNELAALSAEAAGLARDSAAGESSIDALTADLVRTRGWAGLDAIVGSGVRISIGGGIDGPSVEALLDELSNAGAEALAVGDRRVVPGTVVVGRPGALSVDGLPLGMSFDLLAIGDPGVLTASLTRAGGLIARLSALWPDTELTVTPAQRLRLAATGRSLAPRLAVPVQ